MRAQLNDLQAFYAMRLFLEKYYQETNSDDVGSLLGDVQFFVKERETADPAAWHYWMRSVNKILGISTKDPMEIELTELQAFYAMRLFLEKYYEQTSSDDVGSLLEALQFPAKERETADPSVWEEWMECVNKVLSEKDKKFEPDRLYINN